MMRDAFRDTLAIAFVRHLQEQSCHSAGNVEQDESPNLVIRLAEPLAHGPEKSDRDARHSRKALMEVLTS